MKKIAVLTSGGDSQGMNNAIYGIVQYAKTKNIETHLIFEGFKGLVENKIVPASEVNLKRINNMGGTIIKSARFPEFKNIEVRKKAVKNLQEKGIEAVIVIGGDGSFQGAQKLHELGIKAIGLPGTIDNDIASTSITIGFYTALNNIVEAIERTRDTADSHGRCILVEVMGNSCGDLSLYSGLATSAEVIVTNNRPMSIEEIATIVKEEKTKKDSVLVIVSEKIKKYGSITEMAKQVEELSGVESRGYQLGYLQRGGIPTAMERVNAISLGIEAIKRLDNNESGIVLGWTKSEIYSTQILDALQTENSSIEKDIKKAEFFNKILRA
ncbi:ATP-dependent 6-phosphofructokinase [Mycoplasma phocimorsus]|uniref:ATP-dependent 6-phosphofructokinase n=1 Tax=Mycoplasma phocimorsus TaxID=3045839 RepID=UPI0024C048F9|nr:ATP-dependent 6-phosphofructokinase [Mycoplasma phocimorsus]MDJ1646185.1 ATP-dependent 6-phosphofructokinase [Mycoplasma phocimorsus]